MTEMIAINTIHGRRTLRDGEVIPPGHSLDLVTKPGAPFDTADYGIDASEEQSLVDQGVARRAYAVAAPAARRVNDNPPRLGN